MFQVRNFRFKNYINELIQRCIETGITKYFKDKTNRLMRTSTLNEHQISTSATKLIQFEDLKFIFILYLVGVVFSLLIFFAESCYFKLKKCLLKNNNRRR